MLPASLKSNYQLDIKKWSFRDKINWSFLVVDTEDKSKKISSKNIDKLLKILNIEKKLFNKILEHCKIGNVKGIWVKNYSDGLKISEEEDDLKRRELNHSLEKQIKIMNDNKFCFIHYNSGYTMINTIFKKLLNETEYNRMMIDLKFENETTVEKFPDPNNKKRLQASKFTKKHRLRMLEYVYDTKTSVNNPFDNKLVVIDEIHNLTNQMTSNGFNSPIIYELLMRAENCKIVLLSGTPVINDPYELGLLYNLLSGLIYYYKIPYSKEAELKLNTLNSIDYIDSNPISGYIKFTRNPRNFINLLQKESTELLKQNPGLNKLLSQNPEMKQLLKQKYVGIDTNILNSNNGSNKKFKKALEIFLQIKKIDYEFINLFPDYLKVHSHKNSYLGNNLEEDIQNSKNDFYEKYVNKSKSILFKNKSDFTRRIQGLTSHFNEKPPIQVVKDGVTRKEELFPTIKNKNIDEQIVNCVMSDYQFSRYIEMRLIEIKLEERNKFKKKDKNQAKEPSFFNQLSRQACLFAFPPNIPRPRKKKDKDLFKKNIEIKSELMRFLNHFKEICQVKTKKTLNLLINLIKKNEYDLNFMNDLLSGSNYNIFLNNYLRENKILINGQHNFNKISDDVDSNLLYLLDKKKYINNDKSIFKFLIKKLLFEDKKEIFELTKEDLRILGIEQLIITLYKTCNSKNTLDISNIYDLSLVDNDSQMDKNTIQIFLIREIFKHFTTISKLIQVDNIDYFLTYSQQDIDNLDSDNILENYIFMKNSIIDKQLQNLRDSEPETRLDIYNNLYIDNLVEDKQINIQWTQIVSLIFKSYSDDILKILSDYEEEEEDEKENIDLALLKSNIENIIKNNILHILKNDFNLLTDEILLFLLDEDKIKITEYLKENKLSIEVINQLFEDDTNSLLQILKECLKSGIVESKDELMEDEDDYILVEKNNLKIF